MARKPVVFLSSTFYDLRHVRDDIRTFIEDHLGYTAMLSEMHTFPVDPDRDTIEHCRRRVVEHDADILVLVIGGRYGSASLERISRNLYRDQYRIHTTPDSCLDRRRASEPPIARQVRWPAWSFAGGATHDASPSTDRIQPLQPSPSSEISILDLNESIRGRQKRIVRINELYSGHAIRPDDGVRFFAMA